MQHRSHGTLLRLSSEAPPPSAAASAEPLSGLEPVLGAAGPASGPAEAHSGPPPPILVEMMLAKARRQAAQDARDAAAALRRL